MNKVTRQWLYFSATCNDEGENGLYINWSNQWILFTDLSFVFNSIVHISNMFGGYGGYGGYGGGGYGGGGFSNEMRSDMWIQQNVPGGLNST